MTELLRQAGSLVEMAPDHGAELVRGLLTELYRHDCQGGSPSSASERLVTQALRIIHSHTNLGMNVYELAESLGITAEHLSRAFRQHRQRKEQGKSAVPA